MTNRSADFDRRRFDAIQRAYRHLFPIVDGALAQYWDREGRRPWSLLTADFHSASFDQYLELNIHCTRINSMQVPPELKGETLRSAARGCGVGFSFGISPWTDHLLKSSYSDTTTELVILLGHDWYPVVERNGKGAGSPLSANAALPLVPRYLPGAPAAVFDGRAVCLFMNLYPDFRPPGDPKCGSLSHYGYSYDACLAGLDAVIASVRQRFKKNPDLLGRQCVAVARTAGGRRGA